MLNQHQITRIFCEIHDFCNKFDNYVNSNALPCDRIRKKRGPAQCLHPSEIVFILVAFQIIGFRNFKTFYIHFAKKLWLKYFPVRRQLSLPVDDNYLCRIVFLLTQDASPPFSLIAC